MVDATFETFVLPKLNISKKAQEERKRKKELDKKLEEERKAEELRLKNEREAKRAADLRAARRRNDVDAIAALTGTHPKKDSDEPQRTAVEQEEYEQMRLKHYGPDLTKSTFVPRKKKRRRDEFNFGWDDSEDTRTARHRADDEAALARRKPYESRLTTKGSFHWYSQEPEWELQALMSADAVKVSDPEHGEERARAILDEYYNGLRQRDRRLGDMRRWNEKPLSEMRERDWRIFKENFNIVTKGGHIPHPMRYWRESALPSRLLDVVESVGYHEPSAIQRAAIPIALQGRDLIGIAVTGSGKTAAFLLPLLVYIQKLPPLVDATKNDGPYALILAPTRELAQQIETEAHKFATPFGYKVVSIVGGHSLEEQAFALSNGAEIIVATPGRLVDCIERRLLVLSQCCYVIMDEADRMVDLGFEEPLNKILDAMPTANIKPDSDEAEDTKAMTRFLGERTRYRQTMMYTATMPPLVEKIAKRYLRRPAIVTIGNAGQAVDTVEQRVEFIAGEDRRKERLKEILQANQYKPPIIVFVNIKRNCETVAHDVRAAGRNVVTLHGSKTQEQRELALEKVRTGQADVLVATDLAGRGIDVADVSLVINFNMAPNIEQYTHRIGRTGRAGKNGVAITFLGSEDNDVLYDLKQMISKSSISKVPEELRRNEAAQQKPTKGGGGKSNEFR
ncbi:mRNA splicing protein prp28 [Sporothrix curviconia]|uniref:RNA helicase n=1 Tax=Sporothrix curviconia TaxID=1260050 RepID=A0ABP0BHY8_9PEZI